MYGCILYGINKGYPAYVYSTVLWYHTRYYFQRFYSYLVHHTSCFVFSTRHGANRVYSHFVHGVYEYVNMCIQRFYYEYHAIHGYHWPGNSYLVFCKEQTGHKPLYVYSMVSPWYSTVHYKYSYIAMRTEHKGYISYTYSTVLSLFNGTTLASYIVFCNGYGANRVFML